MIDKFVLFEDWIQRKDIQEEIALIPSAITTGKNTRKLKKTIMAFGELFIRDRVLFATTPFTREIASQWGVTGSDFREGLRAYGGVLEALPSPIVNAWFSTNLEGDIEEDEDDINLSEPKLDSKQKKDVTPFNQLPKLYYLDRWNKHEAITKNHQRIGELTFAFYYLLLKRYPIAKLESTYNAWSLMADAFDVENDTIKNEHERVRQIIKATRIDIEQCENILDSLNKKLKKGEINAENFDTVRSYWTDCLEYLEHILNEYRTLDAETKIMGKKISSIEDYEKANSKIESDIRDYKSFVSRYQHLIKLLSQYDNPFILSHPLFEITHQDLHWQETDGYQKMLKQREFRLKILTPKQQESSNITNTYNTVASYFSSSYSLKNFNVGKAINLTPEHRDKRFNPAFYTGLKLAVFLMNKQEDSDILQIEKCLGTIYKFSNLTPIEAEIRYKPKKYASQYDGAEVSVYQKQMKLYNLWIKVFWTWLKPDERNKLIEKGGS